MNTIIFLLCDGIEIYRIDVGVCVYECGVCECVCVVETVWCRRQYELLLFVFIVLRVFSVKGLFLLKHLLYCQRVHINVLNS